ncbi:unnamed protein product [Strongylus vulgaris]|uniref:Serine-threonine/tyrosine-protein kinase catalytic domain-containing protein n=1 Tax=Strongylus vulgaris TaxID=40348 RepID=A0A3P7KYU8_STRVU|nr:unnamed protein product [Strongylus vulgaris]
MWLHNKLICSFAIIASELVTKKPAWDLDNRKEDAEELVFLIIKSSMDPVRPSLDSQEVAEITPALIHLIRECWSEWPRHRPNMKKVKLLLTTMQAGNSI